MLKGIVKCFVSLMCCLFVFAGSCLCHAGTVPDEAILGVHLYDPVAQVRALHPEMAFTPQVAKSGSVLGTKAYTQKGYKDGGFFQVLFSPANQGGGAWMVTRNTRVHIAGQQPEALLADYVEQYGPYELLCREQFPKHAVFHVYWLSAPPGCSHPEARPQTVYLYLNLVTGKWTEEFLVLADPAAGKAIREAASDPEK